MRSGHELSYKSEARVRLAVPPGSAIQNHLSHEVFLLHPGCHPLPLLSLHLQCKNICAKGELFLFDTKKSIQSSGEKSLGCVQLDSSTVLWGNKEDSELLFVVEDICFKNLLFLSRPTLSLSTISERRFCLHTGTYKTVWIGKKPWTTQNNLLDTFLTFSL